jgi:hypothetical protein
VRMTCRVTVRRPRTGWATINFSIFALPSGRLTAKARSARPRSGSRRAVEPVEILLRGVRDFLTFSVRSAVALFK